MPVVIIYQYFLSAFLTCVHNESWLPVSLHLRSYFNNAIFVFFRYALTIIFKVFSSYPKYGLTSILSSIVYHPLQLGDSVTVFSKRS